MLKINFFLLLIQVFLLLAASISGLIFEHILVTVYLTVANYYIAFFIVNGGKRNIINISTFFLLGMGVLILGRFIGYSLYPSNFNPDYLFCNEFFFIYCLNILDSIKLVLFINLTIILFCGGYLKNVKHKVSDSSNNQIYLMKDFHVTKTKTSLLVFFTYLFTAFSFYQLYDSINTALSNGYLALYSAQTEAYETPFNVIINSLLIASLATIFTLKRTHKELRIHFNILFYSVILIGLLSILRGSRATFITSILVLIWYNFADRKITRTTYLTLISLSLLIISFTNSLAELSGARTTGATSSVRASIADTIYSQGVTLMIVDAAMDMKNISLLGYLKTIFPGIQILYPYLGFEKRYEFDWGSNLAYTFDPNLYEAGYGLGWSIFADFYLLSFKILPIYALLLFSWGKFLNRIDSTLTSTNLSLSFILSFYAFSLPRTSISQVIFTLITFYLLLLMLRLRIKL